MRKGERERLRTDVVTYNVMIDKEKVHGASERDDDQLSFKAYFFLFKTKVSQSKA